MKKYLLLVLLYIVTGIPAAMGTGAREMVWAFGYWGGLDFNGGGDPAQIKTALVADEGCASVCDTNGKLLFYSEGSIVWNRKHEVMKNGTALTPIPNTTMTPTSSTSQGVVIVPVLDQPHLYYVFSLIASQWPADFGKLYYSVVDMTLDGGMGAVVEDKKGIFIDDGMLERMTAVAGDNCNVWLLAAAKSGRIRAYEITSSGINNRPVESPVGIGSAGRPYGCMKASPDRKKLAIAQMGGGNGAVLYDFDPATGLAGNELILSPTTGAYDVCFSPGSTKLYTTGSLGTNQTMQFDLSNPNRDSILQSAYKVSNASFVQIKAAPNGKIYFATSDRAMAEISYPDKKGDSCDIHPYKIIFTASPSLTSKVGLPNVVPDIRRRDVYTTTRDTVRFARSLYIKAKDTTGINYTWNDGERGPSRIITTPGKYWVSYNIPPCSYRADTVYIEFICTLPLLQTQNSCFGQANGSAWVESGEPGYVYTWLAGDSVLARGKRLDNALSGNYNLQIRSDLGCDTNLVVPIPGFTDKVQFTADTLVCNGKAVTFRNLSGEGYTRFNWFFGDESTSTDKSPSNVYKDGGRYNVILTGAYGHCRDTAYQVITVDSVPAGFDVAMSRDTICSGESVTFSVDEESTLTGMDWHLGNSGEFSTSPSRRSITHSFDIPGTISLTMKASFRVCPSVDMAKSIHVRPLPVVDLGPDLGICARDFPLTVSNRIHYNVQEYEFNWNTGHITPELSIRDYGRYGLSIKDRYGCTGTGQIDIYKHCAIDLPNVFTPNGDATNDYFFPRQPLDNDIVSFRMQIYNRGGQLLFETRNLSGLGWDGKWDGKEQPSGVYVYIIDIGWKNGKREAYSGNVTLIR